MRVVEAHAEPRDLLRAEGFEEQVGYLGRHISVDQAIAEYQSNELTAQSVQMDPLVNSVPVIG